MTQVIEGVLGELELQGTVIAPAEASEEVMQEGEEKRYLNPLSSRSLRATGIKRACMLRLTLGECL